jgi:hypothetical protein
MSFIVNGRSGQTNQKFKIRTQQSSRITDLNVYSYLKAIRPINLVSTCTKHHDNNAFRINLHEEDAEKGHYVSNARFLTQISSLTSLIALVYISSECKKKIVASATCIMYDLYTG